MPTLLDAEIVADALTRLSGWSGDTRGLRRTFVLDDAQHADFLERVKVTSDAMDHHPDISRDGGATRVALVTHSSGGVTELDIALASRITDLARSATGQEQAVAAVDATGAGQESGNPPPSP